jgi:hypothetical protein
MTWAVHLMSENVKEAGRKGGSKGTEKQAIARRRNILKALAKQHPHSPVIQQALQRLEIEAAKKPGESLAGMDLFRDPERRR